MSAESLYGQTFECDCGRTHHIEPREILYRADAVEAMPALCARATAGRNVAVLMDARTRDAAGAAVAKALAEAGWGVNEVIVPDPTPGGSPVCDDVTREALAGPVGRCDLLVPVGSGVINDLGKWIAFDLGVPFVPFATAASMNGYTSSNVAATLRGVKCLTYAKPPAAVAASPSVIAAAPYELTAAGLGDVLAKSVSSTDWTLNHLLFGDYYCRRSVGLIAEVKPLYLDHPEALRALEPGAINALFEALLLTGVAMTMAETSSPASGGEHMISHTLDMMSSLDGAPHDLHGRQVGVGTILASELYRRVLAVESPEWAEPPADVDAPFWGRLADAVAEAYAQKLARARAAKKKLAAGRTWDDLRRQLAPTLRPPEAVRDALARAGAAHRAEDIGCDRARLLAALTHAHQIRARFTILDLAYLVGVLPANDDDIVTAWS